MFQNKNLWLLDLIFPVPLTCNLIVFVLSLFSFFLPDIKLWIFIVKVGLLRMSKCQDHLCWIVCLGNKLWFTFQKDSRKSNSLYYLQTSVYMTYSAPRRLLLKPTKVIIFTVGFDPLCVQMERRYFVTFPKCVQRPH